MKQLSKLLNDPGATATALVIGIAIAALVLVNSLLAYVWVLEAASYKTTGEARAEQLAMTVSTYVSTLETLSQDYAHNKDVQEAVAAVDTQKLDVIQHQILGLVPSLASASILRLGELGIADPRFDIKSLKNNIEIHLAGESFKGSKTTAQCYADKGEWLLTVATPIGNPAGSGSSGVLILRANVNAVLQQFVSPLAKGGVYSLSKQRPDNLYDSVAHTGESAANDIVYRVPVGIPGLFAGFSPAATTLQRDAFSTMTPLALVLGGAALVIGLILFTYRQMSGQLRKDANNLHGLVARQRGATASAPVVYFKELAPLAESIAALRRDNAASTARSRETVADKKEDSAAGLDGALDIEVTELEETLEFEEDVLKVPAELFREYDIRGPSALIDPALAFAIGRAIGSEALAHQRAAIVVGADGRESTPSLRKQLVQGLLATGIDVIDVGVVATPMLYFACHHLQTITGVMVTGSHNSADFNGFKVMIGGETLCGPRIRALRERILAEEFQEGQGSYRVTEIGADYSRAVIDDVLVAEPVRVVLDCGHGAAAVIAVELFEELGCEVIPLYCALDGRFPNHAPDPSAPENLRDLIANVAKSGASLGIAFDGDGDRIGVVSGSGRIVTADRLLMLFARELLSRHPGADIVFDVKCSRDLATVIAESGGRPIMCRSGHSWIKEKMKESGALLGGEFTGHICFRDRWLGFDDGLYAAARLLELLTTEGRSLDDLLAELPVSVGTAEIHIAVADEHKVAVMAKIAEGLHIPDTRIVAIDGVRIEFNDGWGLVRVSNTSASLSCRFEAQNEASLVRIQKAISDELARLVPDLHMPAD